MKQYQYPLEIPEVVHAAKALAKELGFGLRPGGNAPSTDVEISAATRSCADNTGATPGSDPSACLDEVGSLLRVLVASLRKGRIGEVGTAAGVGTAWLASGLGSRATLTSVELEPRLARAASELFAPMPNVEVVTGDWYEVMPGRAPFDLLFFDGGGREALGSHNWRTLGDLLVPGGMMVLDDLTPEELWPATWRDRPDPKRELALRSGLFTAAEVRVRPDVAVLLMTRCS